MKTYRLVKSIIYVIGGILIFVFHNKILNGANFLIGSVMIVFCLNNLIVLSKEKKISKYMPRIVYDILIFILGIVLMFLVDIKQFTTVCVIWAVWSIIREEWEVSDAIFEYKNDVIKIINIIESIFLIVISVFFIYGPTVDHLHLHIILLGIELMLEVAFPYLDILFSKKRRINKKDAN